MTKPVQPKRSFTANRVPLVSELDVAELSINWADKALYTRSPTGEIVSIVASANAVAGLQWSPVPVSPTAPAAAGEIAYNGEYLFVAIAANSWRRVALVEWSVPTITITQQPADQTSTDGSATFTVAAVVSNSAAASYQWQASADDGATWANLNGETSASLALSGLDETDDGTRYRVTVSATDAANVTSVAAILTVSLVDAPPDEQFEQVALLLRANGNTDDSSNSDVSFGAWSQYGAGRFDSGAFLFNGTYTGVFANSDTMGLGTSAFTPFTVEMWFNVSASGELQTLFDNGQILMWMNADGSINAMHGSIGSVWSTAGFNDSQWHHLALVRESEYLRLYVDGAKMVGNSSEYIGNNSTAGNPTGTHIAIGYRVSGGPFTAGSAPWGFGVSGRIDDVRVSKIARYSGTSFTVPAAPFGGPIPTGWVYITTQPPATLTVYGGAGSLSVIANAEGGESLTYQWQRSADNGATWSDITGATGPTIALSGLTLADNDGDQYRVVVASSTDTKTSTATTVSVDESGINGDNRFRVTAAASTTALTAAVDSTTGYWKMVSSDGQSSAVFGSQWTQYSPYYFNTGTISGMATGAEKTVEVIACDASGTPTGELEYVSFAPSSQAIVAADASGCTSLQGFNLSSSASPYMSMSGTSSMPAGLLSVRALGVAGSGGFYSQWGTMPANTSGGINVAGQSLSAAALDQLYSDLANGTNSARIFVGGNAGTAADDPTIATGKGYTVYGS